MLDTSLFQLPNDTEKLFLIGNAEDDQMGVFEVGREGATNLKSSVSGLNDLLRERQIFPNEGVNVLRFRYLVSH